PRSGPRGRTAPAERLRFPGSRACSVAQDDESTDQWRARCRKTRFTHTGTQLTRLDARACDAALDDGRTRAALGHDVVRVSVRDVAAVIDDEADVEGRHRVLLRQRDLDSVQPRMRVNEHECRVRERVRIELDPRVSRVYPSAIRTDPLIHRWTAHI